MNRVNVRLDKCMIDLLKDLIGQTLYKLIRGLLSANSWAYGSISIVCD